VQGAHARAHGLTANGVALLLIVAGCAGPSAGGSRTGDAAAAATQCSTAADCPAAHFCGAASRTCISEVVQVAAGAYHSCALHRDGGVSCWGLAESINAGGRSVVAPKVIDGVAATALAAGTHLTCALTPERQVRCWGNQAYGVVREDGSPLTGVLRLAVGSSFGCAATADTVYCWGKNAAGQLARPLDVDASARAVASQPGAWRFLGAGEAVVVHDGASGLCAWGDNRSKVVTASDDMTIYVRPQCGSVGDVAELVVGSEHACVRHPAGTFACWGERYYGQLGIGGTETADVPPYGTSTSLPAAVASLVAGTSHTCALLVDGGVQCFGLDSKGQVGPNAEAGVDEVRDPVPVSGFAGRVVALGAGSSAQHTCAVVEDGSVQCWGSDDSGQLGDGVTTVDETRVSRRPVAVRW
jgi:alpha-tubulin suppressor-like RCC1 family protein